LPRTGCLETKNRKLEAKAKSKDSKTCLKIRANINVNIVIMISQAIKQKLYKNGLDLSLLTSLF